MDGLAHEQTDRNAVRQGTAVRFIVSWKTENRAADGQGVHAETLDLSGPSLSPAARRGRILPQDAFSGACLSLENVRGQAEFDRVNRSGIEIARQLQDMESLEKLSFPVHGRAPYEDK